MNDVSVRVYKCAYDFYLYFSQISRGFKRNEKYGLGKDILDSTLAMIEFISIANKARDKVRDIDLALRKVIAIKIRIRLLNGNGTINIINYERCSRSLLEIENQLSRWRNWAEN